MEDGRAGTRWPDFCQAGETRAVAWMGGRAGVRPVACPAGRGQADVGGVVSAEVSERL